MFHIFIWPHHFQIKKLDSNLLNKFNIYFRLEVLRLQYLHIVYIRNQNFQKNYFILLFFSCHVFLHKYNGMNLLKNLYLSIILSIFLQIFINLQLDFSPINIKVYIHMHCQFNLKNKKILLCQLQGNLLFLFYFTFYYYIFYFNLKNIV
ncbi:hypothetical protein IMG5_097510 [Ichthyophthirius multifiliis]|uniref:Transmembrane protein n=1 Tax=Ichthyophthirius multifiliis TaxID=5932 RepID=G0QRU0_ICHMU|nr:hypothetical protein IMG5_097510 [Ichthyophthirius multifiliis]EGR32074.1 hypothetical protein IMG5_097510 [Ichthyophthirius multifiliis]|eukprot:XP_004035560.1 hypothetical protein IMG5_097510 [Ichthyophthirius multifiliis]